MGILRTLAEVKMSIWDTFCLENQRAKLENQRILSEGHRAIGRVTDVKKCWWIKINTKHVRLHALDGAEFPHIIYFTYSAGGAAYQGSECVSWYLRCPGRGEAITVFYDTNDPSRYAVSFPVAGALDP